MNRIGREIAPWLALALTLGAAPARAGEADGGLARKGFFGARLVAPTEEARRAQGVAEGGALVTEVFAGSPASEAGLKAGDVITALGGSKVAGVPDLLASLSRRRAGDGLDLGYVREGRAGAAGVTIRARPRESWGAETEVIYGSVQGRAGRLRTILTRPKGPGKFPAFYLIQGLGDFSIEDVPAGSGFYRRFLDDFARRGYVTFRVDKPGQGDSEGGPTRDVDFEAELDGYREGLRALAGLDFVDRGKIVLFGHSMGGVVAPLIAADAPVRGIAVYGTVLKTWYEYFAENTRRQAALAGSSAAEIDADLRKDALIYAAIFGGGRSPAEVASAHPELAARVAEDCTEGKYIGGRHHVFFRQLAAINLAEAWAKFDGRALALWGGSDYIATEADHALIAEVVNKAHPGSARFARLGATDHGFRHASTFEDAFRAARSGKPGEANPAVLATLRDWADEVTGRAGPTL